MQIISTLLGNQWWLFNPPVICKYLKIVASYWFDLNPPDLYSINSIDKLIKKNKLNEFKQSRPFLISIQSSVHEGTAWENLRKLYKPETQSKISSNCIRNINRPSTLEEVVNRKENIVGWIVKRRQIRKFTHALGEVLFHYVIFCNKENRHFSSKIYRVSFGGISLGLLDRACWLKNS